MIGRMTLLQVFLLYCPVIALNVYGLLQYKMYTTPFYLVIDSLILVGYAVILIIVVMTQREKALSAEEAFNFCELFSFGAIQEMEEEPIQDIYGDSFKGDSFKKDFSKGITVMAGLDEDEPDFDDRRRYF